MKKLLAMVLALVMTLSLAVSANAFTDDSKVNDSYAEAVAVLNGMGVFKGYEDGSFKPEGDITRAEVATIVYRIYTADVAKNDKSSLYATYNKFSDMAGASWAAGYIGYCANAELVKGYPDGTFKPSGKVTGYEVLAMILRAVGYDKNGEFSGADWALHVAQTAQQAGLLKNVKGVDLNAAASRELVAELLFRGIQASTVTYTPAFGYVTDKVIGAASSTIGVKNFDLKSAADSDEWGRPATTWTYNTGDKETTVVEKPVVSYTKAVAECDVAHDAGLKADKAYTLVVNGDALASKYTVNLTDTTTKMGAQGRLVEVYDDTIVMIDTFFAKVTSVADAAYDAQGHLRTPATITLAVYDGVANKTLTLTNGETNYGYAKGDYVLLNAKTEAATINGVAVSNTSTTSGGVINAPATKYGEIVGKADSVVGAQSIIYWNAQQHNVAGTVYDDAMKFILDEAGTTTENHTWYFDQYGNLIAAVDIAAANTYGVINKIWWAGNAADGSGVATANVTYMDGTTGSVTVSKMVVNTAEAGSAYAANSGKPTYSVATADIMSVDAGTATTNKFYLTTDAATNERAEANTRVYTGAVNGIVANNLFQFTTLADNTVVATEVSGNGSVAGYETLHSAALTEFNKNTQINGGLVVNANTVFLVRSENADGSYSYKSITGFANIDSYGEGEYDYVDLNKDGVADYVYITAENKAAKVTSLFYYAGGQAQWNASTETWTIPGYVDGVAGSILADGYTNAEFAKIQNAGANTLFRVALADNALVNATVLTDGSTVTEYSSEYALAKDYTGWTGTITVAVISGNARDNFDGNLYRHDTAPAAQDATYAEYSVLGDGSTGVTKMPLALSTTPAGQNVIVVYNDAATSQSLNRAALQVYAVEKSSAVGNARPITGWTMTAPVISNTTYASAAAAKATVSAPTYGTVEGVNSAATATLKATTSWARWDVTTGDWVAMGAYDPFVTGTTYQYTVTVSIDTMSNGVCAIAVPATTTGVLVCG